MPFRRKPTPEERRRERERFFELTLEVPGLMEGFVLDNRKQLWRTLAGRPVLSRHFCDTELLFGKENQGSPGYY